MLQNQKNIQQVMSDLCKLNKPVSNNHCCLGPDEVFIYAWPFLS